MAEQVVETNCPEYPALVYIYDLKGRYGNPLKIKTHADMAACFREKIFPAIKNGQKVIITDMLDLTMFHAEGGKVIHPSGLEVPNG